MLLLEVRLDRPQVPQFHVPGLDLYYPLIGWRLLPCALDHKVGHFALQAQQRPAARRHQQARATVSWVAPQLEAHVQPGQLVRALGGGPPPHAMAQHNRPVPPRTAQPTRRGHRRSQAVRLSWPCGEAGGRARPCRLRAGRACRARWARRDRPGAPLGSPAPPRRARPTRAAPIAGGEVELALPCAEGHVSLMTHECIFLCPRP